MGLCLLGGGTSGSDPQKGSATSGTGIPVGGGFHRGRAFKAEYLGELEIFEISLDYFWGNIFVLLIKKPEMKNLATQFL